MTRLEKILLSINIVVYVFLLIFSYAYVDLNLTLSQNRTVLSFVGFMQQLGYYHRPQATLLYLAFVLVTSFIFITTLVLFAKNKLSLKYLLITSAFSTAILIFAYPFLSSDIFNYLFDSKIIWKYHESPYAHKPLDFPQDDWLRFMRWTHRYSPYGPGWLGLSLIPASLSFGKFIINLFALKVFLAIFHLVNIYLVYKFLKTTKSRFLNLGLAFYALNPLVLIEGVTNGHNDVVLATFILAPLLLVAQAKRSLAIASLAFGFFIKYITVLTLPAFVLQYLYPKKINPTRLVQLNLLIFALFTIYFSSLKISVPFVSSGATQVQFQPWYLFWTIPLVALIPSRSLLAVALATSAGASLRYLPYIYYGDWSHPITQEFMQIVLVSPLIIVLVFLGTKKYLLK